MEIIALGHSGFRLRGKDVTIVIDPPHSSVGGSLKGITADIICVTHDHPGHNNVAAIGGTPRIVKGPGEYEIGGVLITALRTFHDAKQGAERGSNTVYIIHMEDLVICHLGDLGHELTAAQQQEASGADILMLPIGGKSTIDATKAAEINAELEAGVTIPMHYKTDKPGTAELAPVNAFCQAVGVPVPDPLPKFVITRATVTVEPQVVILSTKG